MVKSYPGVSMDDGIMVERNRVRGREDEKQSKKKKQKGKKEDNGLFQGQDINKNKHQMLS